MELLEAVPNVSEGKDPFVVGELAACLTQVRGVSLLHTDSNPNANRTVFTLAGDPQAVIKACFELYRGAAQRIDMRQHRGEHPRLGAVDVCPLVPLKNISPSQAAAWADKLARRVAQELQIPVYLYEENAVCAERKNLADIRRGEYESLPQKLTDFPPDYGPREFSLSVARTGATVIGAREFLIAFNMSLNTKQVQTARKIAARLREKNGGLAAVKAIGWYMADYECAQVSCNLTNYHQTSLAVLFETCKQIATEEGVQITAGELIGLVPQEALMQAGQFYLPHETNTDSLIRAAVSHLRLNNIRPFIPNERILEQKFHF